MSQSSGSGFFRQRIDDASAAVVYLRSLWGVMSLSRQRRGLESALTTTQADLGEAAEKAQAGGDLPAMRPVREARTSLTTAQNERETRAAELAAAEEKRRQTETQHDQIVAPSEVAYAQLRKEEPAANVARSTTQKQVAQIEADIGRMQASLTVAAQGKPGPQPANVLQQELDQAQSALAPAQQKAAEADQTHRKAQAATQARRTELDGAVEARRRALGACDAEISKVQSAVRLAEFAIHKRAEALAASHGELGRAVLEARLSGTGIDQPLARAQELIGKLAAVGEQSARTQAQVGANCGGAIRSAAALIVLVLAVGLVWMLAAKLMRPRQPATARGTTQPAMVATNPPSAAANPTPSASSAGPGKLKPEDLHPAILAMPSLAVRTDDAPPKNVLFKPTGKITCTERRPMAGGNETFRFAVEVQTRPSAEVPLAAGEMAVEVVVDEAGQVLSCRTTGYTDPDMLEIIRQEEARPGRP